MNLKVPSFLDIINIGVPYCDCWTGIKPYLKQALEFLVESLLVDLRYRIISINKIFRSGIHL